MERTDNLSAELIPDKESFLKAAVGKKDSLDYILSVDITGYEIKDLNDLSAVEILSQSSNQSTRYVWIKKIIVNRIIH